MLKNLFKYSLLVLIASIAIRVLIINQTNFSDEDEAAFKLQEESTFSKNVKSWLNKGNYFMYKNKYKIFYILIKIDTTTNKEIIINKKLDFDAGKIINVYLHGFPTSSYDYSKIWKNFLLKNNDLIVKSENGSKAAKEIYLLTFDYIGFGFSDKPFNYSYSMFDYADICDSLLLNLNVLNVNLIAHDVGDSVAQEIIRRYNLNQLNFKINKLVLTNGAIFIDIYQPVLSQIILRTEMLNNIFAKYMFNPYLFSFSFKKMFGKLYQTNNELSNDIVDFYSIISYRHGQLNLPLTIRYLNDREQYNEVWLNALNETSVPIMMIYGPDDPINPDKEYSFKIRNDLPKIKFVKLDTVIGHYPQWEDPFNVFQIMYDFLFTK